MTRFKRILLVAALLLLPGALYLTGMLLHLYGEHEGAGRSAEARISEQTVRQRTRAQQHAAAALSSTPSKTILFGDLHVHSTFSTDAFLWSLPMMNGEGAHPVGDACDYARFCSALDFWSINDHAEAMTPRKWNETKQAIRQCNAIAGDREDPDVVAFLGWEWSQIGRTPEDHYGHKNVILRDLEDELIPARPIGAAGLATQGIRNAIGRIPAILPLLDFQHRQRYYNFMDFADEIEAIPRCEAGVDTRQLPPDCYESAATPGDLFEKLAQWGMEAIVIPHGNTWGFYSPPGITLDKQLNAAQNDPNRQFLFEIMSGHGNSEQYRDWRAVSIAEDGSIHCPEPSPNYLPSCWRAGQIIEARCLAEGLGETECASRAARARQDYADAGVAGHLSVPGVEFEQWLDAGQCTDCFIPSFSYRPGGSGQYALAISNFDDPDAPERFRFGFIASSDNHRARPGTGFKELDRKRTTEANGPRDETWRRRVNGPAEDPVAQSVVVDRFDLSRGFRIVEAERQASFFMTGGLAAVHSVSRSREDIWQALARKEVYGTSGDRILLWFTLLNAETSNGMFRPVPMGGEATMGIAPRFEVRAAGAFVQKPGCPEDSATALGAERLASVCGGECYNPSDERKQISRIEVIRIRPQIRAAEPVAPLIDDPWQVFECPVSAAGCVVRFEDPDFVRSGRPAVYYVRAIEAASPAINAGNVRCQTDESGSCVAVDPCYGDYRTDASDDCTAPIEERAWSSPIYVDPS